MDRALHDRPAQTTDRSLPTPWRALGRHPQMRADLPDRRAGYIGWAAVGAWVDAHPEHPLSQLASVTADEFQDALH